MDIYQATQDCGSDENNTIYNYSKKYLINIITNGLSNVHIYHLSSTAVTMCIDLVPPTLNSIHRHIKLIIEFS